VGAIGIEEEDLNVITVFRKLFFLLTGHYYLIPIYLALYFSFKWDIGTKEKPGELVPDRVK
jgi:hypothetical protein